jgi:hypothetical protein
MFGKLSQKRGYLQAAVLLLLLALVVQMSGQVRDQVASSNGPRPMGVAGVPASGAVGSVAEAPVTVLPDGTIIGHSVKNDVSPALRDIKPIPAAAWTTVREMPEPKGEGSAEGIVAPPVSDAVAQRTFGFGTLAMPGPLQNFAGVGNIDGVYPPDTNGDVGLNHYVQWVNLHFQIFNKSGGSLYGPAAGNTLWNGFGGACQSQNAGDPIVLYDSMADRWLMSQFTSSAPYGECIAISTTGDPTGSYYRYFFQHSTSVFYDYPHLGVWPDGYYAGFNRFGGPLQTYQGPSAIVYDRAKMLLGQPATYQEKQLSSSNSTLQPADLDGATLPPAGSPNYFVNRGSTSLNLFKFQVDWATPANSTFTGPTALPVAGYTQLCAGTRSCIPQPGTTVKLDGIGDRVLHRLAYRNFGDHEAMVINHNVDAGGGQAGVRWYEVRSPNSAPTIFQQGTYAPDATNRWMGSIAMDGQGNMALGYSVSSSTVYPGIRYTGRLVSDALGTMSQGETTLINGSGSQTGSASRWGDYSMMSIDPADDCTFWFTTEYMATTGGAPWVTRIGAFKFSTCGSSPIPTPTQAVATATPVPPATATSVPPTATPNPSSPDFALTVTPASQTIARPNSATYTVNVSPANGFSGNISLSVSGLPGKTSGSFSPNPVAGGAGSSVLTITTQRNGPTGTFTLTITGTSGGTSHSQNVTLMLTR